MSTCAIRGAAPHAFVVGTVLGEGRWGRVHRAVDLRTGEVVAVKIVGPDGADELTHGFDVARAIPAHPGLVAIHELVELEDGCGLAMELAGAAFDPGSDADPVARDALARAMARQVALALLHLHAHGWIHRDVKPANVLVDGDRVVLADLGLAHPRSTEGLVAPAGTPPYMAPEAVLRWTVGPASDWYALGVTLYEVLTGNLPYDAPSLQEELLAKQQGRAPDLSDVADVPFWAPLFAGLLAPDPGSRWGGADLLAYLGVIPPG